MLQKEFFERTNINLTEDEFNNVNAMYMAAGNIDKDQFCKDYKKHSDSELLEIFYNQSENLVSKVNAQKIQINELVRFMIDQSEAYSSVELRSKAIQIIGIREYLKYKIQRGYNLWDIDKEDMIEILNNK